jgi:hypothetical protein
LSPSLSDELKNPGGDAVSTCVGHAPRRLKVGAPGKYRKVSVELAHCKSGHGPIPFDSFNVRELYPERRGRPSANARAVDEQDAKIGAFELLSQKRDVFIQQALTLMVIELGPSWISCRLN